MQKKAEDNSNAETGAQLPQDNRDLRDSRSFNQRPQVEFTQQKSINIRNVVEDFKKTIAAIGASDEINEEVKAYLKLVDTQAQKEKPSSKLIKANLTNAAVILDEYISVALNKPSKVVTDWINAVLLQKIDYKADASIDEEEVVPPEETAAAVKTETLEQEAVQQPPVNKKLSLFYKKTEKLVDAGKFQQAMMNYEKLLPRVKKVGDQEIETQIYMDKAYMYDVQKDLPNALKNYDKAASLAAETGNSKTRALCHYNIASIYDESGNKILAMKHYYAALSHDGQVDNIKAQTHTLNDVGNLLSSKGKFKKAVDHYQVGLFLTKETNDLEGKSYLLSNTAAVFKAAGMDDRALKFYKKSIQCDMKTGNLENFSLNYEKAADIMSENKRVKKAENMYQKSLNAAQKLGDSELSDRILTKLAQNNLTY